MLKISRREFFKFLIESIAAFSFLRVVSAISFPLKKNSIRPPGAVEEKDFILLCIRCGICMEVCPTNAILMKNDVTPVIDPSKGPCEFYMGRCEKEMKCSKYCPTGALKLVDKEKVKMGTVEFFRDKCLAVKGLECVVCYEMCPKPNAIIINGNMIPVFNESYCVGCGICFHYCPADPKALKLHPLGVIRPHV